MKHREHIRGYTIGELLGVVVVIAVLSMVAFPMIRSLTYASRDAGAASDLAMAFNRAKDQARRRNRAVFVNLRNFGTNEPRGRLEAFEANGGSCSAAVGNLEGANQIADIPFGQTLGADNTPADDRLVGLFGWRIDNGANQTSALELCISPKGSSWRVNGNAIEPVKGLSVWIQRFGEDMSIVGPPRAIDFKFATGASLRVGG